MRSFLYLGLCLLPICSFTQSLSVNANGAVADQSAILDISSSVKGLLIPRMTNAERASISSPAAGLTIYQTDGTAGFYYNSGTAGSPAWTRLTNSIDNKWTGNATHIYNTNAGNVGIGNTNPRAELGFSGNLGQKIALWDDGNAGGANYGIGIQAGLLQLYSYTAADDIVFGYGSSSSLTERMRVKGNGNVGIGTNDPQAKFQVVDNSVVFNMSGDVPGVAGPTPVTGTGRRLLWYADKAAFRVGYVDNGAWDAANIGVYSFAAGFRPTASNAFTIALGLASVASGSGSMAVGTNTISSGFNSVAIGPNSVASASNAVVLGANGSATNSRSIAVGEATVSGNTAVGLGFVIASGDASFAAGYATTASGGYSSALGYGVSTNGNEGSFAIGDHSTSFNTFTSAPHQMVMRFAGGYRLYSNSNANVGVQVAPGGNAWVVISDINRKENFEAANGEDVLQKIGSFQLGSWNYIGQEPSRFRHYGPMAQDFFKAFGADKFGTIGNDTTINQADLDGITLIAVQALEKRTGILQSQLEMRNRDIGELKQEVAALRKILGTHVKN